MQHEGWNTVIDQGTVGSLIKSTAESEAEIARYLEYLFLEKKWRTARNMSSLTHLADLISRRRELPISAVGFVIVSHTDAAGADRLNGYGSVYYDLDQTSDYDDLTQNTDASLVEKETLVPWTSDAVYQIPRGTVFKSARGTEYVATETVEIRPLKEPYSMISSDPVKLDDFRRAGGWGGIKYLKVPVIQGIETTVQLGTAKGTRFEAFTLSNVSVEAASNSISKSFMNVRVYPSGVSTPEVWARIENIRLADPYDKVYEVKYLTSSGNVLIKFGDGYTGQRLPALARVEFDFLDTKGEDGNLEDKFQITTIILPGGTSQVDPRTNDQVEFLSCTNISPILGGKFVESEDDFRVNAPVSYLKSYTTSTMQSYYEKIFKYSPVSLLTLRLFNSDVVSATSVGQSSSNDNFVSTIDTDVFTEILTKRSAIYISAIRSNGTKFDDPDAELIEPLERALVDYKSPGDSFQYLEPNFIQLRPNIIVGTYDSINEATVRAEVISKIMSKYSIFNTDFEKPYYSSVINDLVSELSYVSYVKLQLEARATVASKPIVTKSDSPATPDVCLFEFKFDPSFANDKLNAGFKNFLTKTQYVLRADVAFSSRPSASRTFVLLDSRDSTLDAITLYDALTTPITTTKIMPSYTIATYDEVKAPNLSERENSFANRQSRTAQFPYISKIITDSYLNRMLSFSIEPFEIRPLHVDTTGANKQFVKDEVVESDRVSLNLTSTGADATGDYVYKIDSNYYEYAQLLYTENYQQPNSADYAHGYFVIQLSDLLDDEQYANLEKLREDSADSFDVAAEVEKLITGSVSISVWAQPIASDFETVNPNDIIFTAGDEIVVEKQYLTAR